MWYNCKKTPDLIWDQIVRVDSPRAALTVQNKKEKDGCLSFSDCSPHWRCYTMPSWHLGALFLLHAVFIAAAATLATQQEPLANDCPTLACGGIEINFPFSHNLSPENCNASGVRLQCSPDNITMLNLPSSQSLVVTSIDYASGITVQLPSSLPRTGCPWLNLTLPNTTGSAFIINYFTSAILVSCLNEFNSSVEEKNEAVPISCLRNQGHVIYAISYDLVLDSLPSDCRAVKNYVMPAGKFPLPQPAQGQSFKDAVNNFNQRREIELVYLYNEVISSCSNCAYKGKGCGFNKLRDQIFCTDMVHDLSHHHKGSRRVLIIGISIGLLVVLLSGTLLYFYISREAKKEKETHLKVEHFLANYKDSKPTRYTYAAIKKITKRFNHKLGEGGFGSVYKGQLPNGIPVAVKMLLVSRGHGVDFINEVGTIGRIHHANVVRLLGFCLDGSNCALVYEYMPNESLEKFIFSDDSRKSNRPLSIKKLQEIALGIAQGIEYLHQGCDHRILHFDIKPHNILLDHNFNPKISDFGLAKLSSRDQSIVTITTARGTMGYIAPEIYSRNFGAVSSKSDVFSFGMVLLEMVSGRKNSIPSVENPNDIYFLEWIYEKLVEDEKDETNLEMDGEREIFKKLAIVGLWCIQWNPADRPSMTRVVQMLMTNMSLQIPPKPYASSNGQDVALIALL